MTWIWPKQAVSLGSWALWYTEGPAAKAGRRYRFYRVMGLEWETEHNVYD